MFEEQHITREDILTMKFVTEHQPSVVTFSTGGIFCFGNTQEHVTYIKRDQESCS